MLTLADVLEAVLNVRPARAEQIAISDVVVDSRQARAGSLFIALKGESLDGHDFIRDAFARGAAVVIAEPRVVGLGLGPRVHLFDSTQVGAAGLQPGAKPRVPAIVIADSSLDALHHLATFWRKKFSHCKTIGVTGSVGKSSTKEMIAAVLRQRFRTLKSEGNLNSETGLPLMIFRMNETHERAVLEMAMYARGEIRALCAIARPSIGVVTNIGPSHLERLGTLERIAQAKAELIESLPRDGVAILNGDDARVLAMRAQTRARVMSYGTRPDFDMWADAIESRGLDGIAFTLHHGIEKIPVRVPMLGKHVVHNALAAAAVGIAEEIGWDDIVRGLQDESAQLRLVAIPDENGATILDDTYNASPASSLSALDLLASLRGRKLAVLGDMRELGAMEKPGHQIVGERVAQVADILIAVGARGKWIGDAARDAGMMAEKIFFAAENADAIAIVRELARAGDVILVKGSRGVAMEEIVSAIKRKA
ncbi:MAG: UDP-N-acetylmuramoyl-tripeptide--D-alanyl-D-alanine ligase [Chloroflexi bacterium]|nr:UDP-N-acetylmuramoyl-tripeptide--D-alanyl-D-alanine ligase [Chloroflexota bacterium]